MFWDLAFLLGVSYFLDSVLNVWNSFYAILAFDCMLFLAFDEFRSMICILLVSCMFLNFCRTSTEASLAFANSCCFSLRAANLACSSCFLCRFFSASSLALLNLSVTIGSFFGLLSFSWICFTGFFASSRFVLAFSWTGFCYFAASLWSFPFLSVLKCVRPFLARSGYLSVSVFGLSCYWWDVNVKYFASSIELLSGCLIPSCAASPPESLLLAFFLIFSFIACCWSRLIYAALLKSCWPSYGVPSWYTSSSTSFILLCLSLFLESLLSFPSLFQASKVLMVLKVLKVLKVQKVLGIVRNTSLEWYSHHYLVVSLKRFGLL